MKNIFIKICLSTFFSILFIGCGLPSYTVVEEPVLLVSDTSYVGFKAPAIDTDISGYEIYYKIYIIDDAEIEEDKVKFDSSSDNYTYSYGSTKPVSLKFNRLYVGSDETSTEPASPLISIDDLTAGNSLKIYIDSADDGIFIGLTNVGLPLRSVTDSVGNFKTFSNNVISTDSDNNKVIADTRYSVSFVAYSFVSITQSSLVSNSESSIPVFLGTISNIANTE